MMDLAVIHGILLLAYFGTSQACMGLGGCGGGGGGGGIGGCSQCCARARGTKTHSGNPKQFGAVLRTDGNRPSTMVLIQLAIFVCDLPLNMKVKNPNDDFLTCCKDAGLPSACLSKCSFSRYNKDTLRNMFFGLDACPIQAANDMHFCATKSMDHRECCARNGVGNTLAGDKCLIFCAPPSQNETRLDFSFMPCYERFERMKSCFWRNSVVQYQRERFYESHNNKKHIIF